MDFETSPQQQMIVDSVSKYVHETASVEHFRRMRDTKLGWSKDRWKQMADYGWLALAFPETLGGLGGDFTDLALVLQQLAVGLVPEPIIPSVVLAGSVLQRLASKQQVEQVLSPMVNGEATLALAYAERQSRYNLAECNTTATARGDDWIISGEKVWVLNGHAADWIVVIARTSGEESSESGLSAFLVSSSAEGLTRIPVNTMDGGRAAFLRFDQVSIPSEGILGERDQAFLALDWAIDRGAAAACAEGQGHIQRMFQMTLEHLQQREQFGVKIGSFQALQHRAAEMLSEVELCRGMMLLAALKVDCMDPHERREEISAAKAHLTSSGWFVQENAIQLHGGIGVTDEQDVGLHFKRLRVLQALFGDEDYHVDRLQSQPAFLA